MPKCKYCGENITKFDKEICPCCGAKKPLAGNGCETTDITESIKTIAPDDEARINFKPKKKIINGLLCMFLGVFGLDSLYLGYKTRFLVRLIVNAILYICLVLVFYFTNQNSAPLFIFLLPFAIIFTVYFVIGIVLLLLKNKKDSNGAFLQ